MRDMLDGTTHTGSPFLPTGDADDRGPTTAQRMQHYAELAPPLAVEAAAAALRSSGLRGADLTHLVTVSCTGFVAPGVDVALIRALGLPPTVQRTHVGYMGCHGAFNGLRVARAFSRRRAGRPRSALCRGVMHSALSLRLGRAEGDRQRPVRRRRRGRRRRLGRGRAAGSVARGRDGVVPHPRFGDAMTWTIGDHGFEMTLSRRVPRLIAQHLRPWLEDWLHRHGVALDDVGSWAVHPGGPRILDAVEEGLGLPRSATDVSRAVLAEYGNMSSPTVLFILDRLRQPRAPRPCVALGFGPGLMAEALLLR